jgi:hypothetical protein
MLTKQNSCVIFLVIVVLSLITGIIGCTNNKNISQDTYPISPISVIQTPNIPTENQIYYQKYEMKSDDIRLKYFLHPLFSFEYPDRYYKVQDFDQTQDSELSGNYSDMIINGVGITKNGNSIIIRVQKPGYKDNNNANALLLNTINSVKEITDNYTLSKICIGGVNASYLEYYQKISEPILGAEITLLFHYMSTRIVIFDYRNLIWELIMDYHYSIPEPTRAREIFCHIIDTFKFLD